MHSRVLATFSFVVSGATFAGAQMVDGPASSKRVVSIGVLYAHDQWDRYWEGTLKRGNGNIGTFTAQSVTVAAAYAIADHFGVTMSLPYIETQVSEGTLEGQHGIQDLSLAASFRVFAGRDERRGDISVDLAGSAAIPASHYTPDLLPLSIGTAGRRVSAGATAHFQSHVWWFADASAAYTWRADVKLDRNAYYTDGVLHETNVVSMPDVTDYSFTIGAAHARWSMPLSIVQQLTLGGGDVRRQDVPFVSNRMNFTSVAGTLVYELPGNVSIRGGAGRVLNGRNVGQSTTLTSGVSYDIRF